MFYHLPDKTGKKKHFEGFVKSAEDHKLTGLYVWQGINIHPV